MEHFELVEKLVNTFGVSYEKAKAALEASGWDPIDAAILIEREKNAAPVEEDVKVSSEPEEPKASPEEAKEEPRVNTNPKGSFQQTESHWKEDCGNLFKTIWNFLSQNDFVVKKESGEVFLDIPLWLSILLLCAFFWPIVLILGIVFIMGYRFSFSGPNLGKKSVKNAVDHMESATEEFVEKVKNSVAPDSVEPAPEQPEPVEPNPESNPSGNPDNSSGAE